MIQVLIAPQLYLRQIKVENSICRTQENTFIFECLGYIDIVKLLIEHKADVNAPSRTNQNALIDATLNGHYETVKVLIEHGADVNARNGSYDTVEIPLMYAVQYKRLEIAKLLIDNGADVNAGNHINWTPIISATANGWDQIHFKL